jgi:uncharacterized protein YjlB
LGATAQLSVGAAAWRYQWNEPYYENYHNYHLTSEIRIMREKALIMMREHPEYAEAYRAIGLTPGPSTKPN